MSEGTEATLSPDGDCVVFQVPLCIKRRRGRKEIIAPAGMDGVTAEEARTNRRLAVTIARAHRWRELLESGRYGTIRELAADLGVDNSYVARILRLTLLAPDLIEAIMRGDEPDGLSLDKLYQAPVPWEEQRRLLGVDDLRGSSRS
jgi:hypothetical protein